MPATTDAGASRRRSLILPVALTLLLAFSTLAPAGQKQSKIEDDLAGVEISDAELRVRVRSLAIPLSGIIEETADQVHAMTTEAGYRQQTLQWKINVIPAIQAVLFQTDPQVALLEIWALTAQLRTMFTVGTASNLPEDLRQAALAGVDKLEQEVLSVAGHLGPPEVVEELRRDVETWAARHPPTNTIITRMPTAAELAVLTADNKVGIRKSAIAVSETMDGLTARLDVYSMYLPKQARWEAEYLAMQLMGGENLETVLVEFTELNDTVKQMAGTVNSAPDLIAAERRVILDTLREERIVALDALEQQMDEMRQFISDEREEIFSTHIQAERDTILAAITVERSIALESLREERVAAMAELSTMTEGVVTDSLKGLVDYFFLRLVQLAAVFLILLLIGFLFLRKRTASA